MGTRYVSQIVMVVALLAATLLAAASPVRGSSPPAGPALSAPDDLWRWGLAGLPSTSQVPGSEVQAIGIRWYQNWGF